MNSRYSFLFMFVLCAYQGFRSTSLKLSPTHRLKAELIKTMAHHSTSTGASASFMSTAFASSNIPSNTVIILTGATAAGKSAAAMKLSLMFPGQVEIVNGDSVQIYKGLDIGANKPSIEEQSLTRHHLIDICHLKDTFSAGDFVRSANDAIRDILRRNKLPIVVGGSTMWIQWLVEGIRDNPKASDDVYQRVQEMLEKYQSKGLWDDAIEAFKHYDEKKILDLNRNDWYRLSRRLEVAITKRETTADTDIITFSRKSFLHDLNVKCFFLAEEREVLYRKIDDRCVDMLRIGFFQEVKRLLLEDEMSPDSMGALAIGYRQTLEYFCRSDYKRNDMDAFVEYLT
jgi:tRNA dimethylallyltransferase